MRRSGRRPGVTHGDEGVALVLVLVVLALLLAVVGEFAQAMRLESLTTVNFRNAVAAAHLAEAGYHRALAEILPEAQSHETDPAGLLVFRRQRLVTPEAPTREDLAIGPGHVSYRLSDEMSRLNLNRATPEILHRLLSAIGVERTTRDVIVDSILDWRDPNEEYRLNGAESEYYLGLPVPHRSKNGDFDSVDELLQIRGMTPDILYGSPGSPRLADYLTVVGSGAINVNTVSPIVLRALGFAEPEADLLIARRPYVDLAAIPSQLRRGNHQTRTDTFRVEAWGTIAGQRGQRLTAVVQRTADTDQAARVKPLQWRWTIEESTSDTPPTTEGSHEPASPAGPSGSRSPASPPSGPER